MLQLLVWSPCAPAFIANTLPAGESAAIPKQAVRFLEKKCHPALQLQPVVPPQVSHFMQVPFRTRVKEPQDGQGSPS
jgi:hypothetical protein